SINGRLKAAWLLRCVSGGRRNFAKKNNQLQIKVIEVSQLELITFFQLSQMIFLICFN
ncbi:hypothetical protein KSS87_000357, partial [Heliosperma pusillum]